MMRSYPLLHELKKLFCLRDNLISIRLSCNKSMVVIDEIPLSSRSLEEIKCPFCDRSKCQMSHFKCQLVMTQGARRR
jgi:hypothetical protein